MDQHTARVCKLATHVVAERLRHLDEGTDDLPPDTLSQVAAGLLCRDLAGLRQLDLPPGWLDAVLRKSRGGRRAELVAAAALILQAIEQTDYQALVVSVAAERRLADTVRV
jgi:hypothetical protein